MWTFDDDLGDVEIELKSLMKANVASSAARVAESAAVPVDTGRLKKSARVRAPQLSGGVASDTIEYGEDYASYVHDGHMSQSGRFVQGQPFLNNALNADEPNLDDDVARDLEKLGCKIVLRY